MNNWIFANIEILQWTNNRLRHRCIPQESSRRNYSKIIKFGCEVIEVNELWIVFDIERSYTIARRRLCWIRPYRFSILNAICVPYQMALDDRLWASGGLRWPVTMMEEAMMWHEWRWPQWSAHQNHPIIGIRATLRLDLQSSGNIASIKQKDERGPTLPLWAQEYINASSEEREKERKIHIYICTQKKEEVIPIWRPSVFRAWLQLDSCNIGIITHTAAKSWFQHEWKRQQNVLQ